MAGSTVGVKLDDETRARLKRLGELKDRSAHWLMKQAIGRYLEAEERYEAEKAEDEARYQEFVETGSHLTQGQMRDWLDELAEEASARKA